MSHLRFSSYSRVLRAAVLVALVATQSALAQQGDTAGNSLAERLISLRGEVDALQSELDVRREEHKNRMAYLTAQLGDLEASRNRESLRVTQLQSDLAEMQAEISAEGVSSESLTPFALEQIARLRQQVLAGFPFKLQERTEALDELETQLSNGLTTAQRAVNRLWAFIKDELRISRENAIYTQSISLSGENVLVDVAKLGSAMMYFRTRDLKYGRALPDAGGWRFELLESGEDQKRVALLFDSLRKQIRQGYFELPTALPPAGGAS